MRSNRAIYFLLIVILSCAPRCRCRAVAADYDTDDPEVMQSIDRALKFLENSQTTLAFNQYSPYGDGVHVLKAYAHHKVVHDRTIPMVRRGIDQAVSFAKKYGDNPSALSSAHKAVYEASISILLLCDVGPDAFDSEIKQLRDFLYDIQKDHGGFGYAYYGTGDVSQVQYVMLAFWTLKNFDFQVDPEKVAACLAWLTRVQDPSGAWPYQGNDPGPDRPLRSQESEVGMSMALAGGSACMIAGEVLGFWSGRDPSSALEKMFPGMPKAVRIPVVKKPAKSIKAPGNLKNRVLSAIKLCERYRDATPFERHHWFYYQLYTLERYESFLANVSGKDAGDSPDWYNRGVETLLKTQSPDGCWGKAPEDSDKTRSENSTAFALLFLIRSTQQAIAAASSGTLAGGQGLPKDTTDIKIDGTKISDRNESLNIGNMLDLLEDDGDDLTGKSIPDDLQLAQDPTQLRAQLDRLERLLRGSQSWQARRVAARLLGMSDQMRVVPSLIYALSDPDTSVRRYARDGLRFISRRFDGFGLADDPAEIEIKQVQEKWRQWYLKINPKYVFLR